MRALLCFYSRLGHMNNPVLRAINDDDPKEVVDCPDDVCSV